MAAVIGRLAWRHGRADQREAAVMEAGSADSRAQRLREVVTRQPTDRGAHLALASHCEAAGRPAEAAWEYQEAITLRRGPDAEMGLALALGRLRLHDLAIERLEALLARPDAPFDARRALGEFYLLTGRPERGVAVLTADPAALRRSATGLLALGRLRFAAGELLAARTAIDAHLRLSPRSPEGTFWLGLLAARAGNAEEARRHWERGAALAPSDPRFPFQLGMLAQQTRLTSPPGPPLSPLSLAAARAEARAENTPETGRGSKHGIAATHPGGRRLFRSNSPSPKRGGGRGERLTKQAGAYSLSASSMDSLAARHFEEALQRAPGYGPALTQKGLLAERRGDHREAGRQLLLAIQSAPSDPEPHRHLSAVLDAMGEPAEAAQHRGLYYSLRDQPSRAITEYARLEKLQPEGTDAATALAQSYIQMQQNERAARTLADALRRHPGDPSLYENLAKLYILTLSRSEAASLCQRWLQVQPEAAGPHWLLGRIAIENQQIEEAVEQFEAAAAREPGDATYAAALGSALARPSRRQDPPRALQVLRRSAALQADDADIQLQLGAVLLQKSDWQAARAAFMAALNRDPSLPQAFNGLVQVAQALRRPGQVALWARAMRLARERNREETALRRAAGARPGDPTTYLALATALLRAGEPASAANQVDQALSLRPNWPEARRLLARVSAIHEAW